MPKCAARVKTCKNPECEYRYTEEEKALWNCPQCHWPRQCERNAITGSEVCGVHGAGYPEKRLKLPGRKETTMTKGKYAPKRLLERLERLQKDPNYLELRDNIDLIDARIAEVMDRLEDRPMLDIEQFGMLIAEMGRDGKDAKEYTDRLWRIHGEAKAEWKTWEHFLALTEAKRKLSIAEKQRLLDMRQTMTVAEMVNVLAMVSLLIRTTLVVGDVITDATLEKIRVGFINAFEGRFGGRDSQRHQTLPAPEVQEV